MSTAAAPWLIRAATPEDAALLGEFRCASGAAAWDVEVERFVRTQLVPHWAFDPHAVDSDPRALMLFERATNELVGVAAHELAIMQTGDGEQFRATKLEVVALNTHWQGQRFGDGTRASDVLMSSVMHDIAARVPPRHQRSFVVIHEDNVRSLSLAARYGFVNEITAPAPGYRRLTT